VSDLELMVIGALSAGPKKGEDLKAMLEGYELGEIAGVLQQMRDRELVVFLERSHRFALVYGGQEQP
jgi:hypothetical protein